VSSSSPTSDARGESPALSLRPVAERLRALLGEEVDFVGTGPGEGAAEAVQASEAPVVLLENTRFHPGETAGDAELAERFASLGSLFVNDAFGAAHRDHASTGGLARAMRDRGGEAVAGLLMTRELEYLDEALADPAIPFVALLGGAKISGKLDVIDELLPRVDRLLVGGAMANTFFRAMGLETGGSLVEEDRVEMAADLLEQTADRLLLPVDCVVAPSLDAADAAHVVARSEVELSDRMFDSGAESRALFAAEIGAARTVLWNGPMGVFETPPFDEGTIAVARAVAVASDGGALTVVGGGDSAAAADRAGVAERLSHVSTGGGAALDLLAGEALPGIESLTDADDPADDPLDPTRR